MIIAQLNINSLRNKFGLLVQMLRNNINIILVSETKIDSSFPIAHFQIEGYTAYRQDMPTAEVILFCIKEDIPSKPLNSDVSIKSFYFQIDVIERNGQLDNYSSKYDNFVPHGDLTSEPTESTVRDFRWICSCKNLIKGNTCFRTPLKPSCIDLIITNRPKSFQNYVTVTCQIFITWR